MTDNKFVGVVEAGMGGSILFCLVFAFVAGIAIVGFGPMDHTGFVMLIGIMMGVVAFFGFITYDGIQRYRGEKNAVNPVYIVAALLAFFGLLNLV